MLMKKLLAPRVLIRLIQKYANLIQYKFIDNGVKSTDTNWDKDKS